jgi:hypothetical protein
MPDDEILRAATRAIDLSDEGKVGMAPREKWGLRPRVARQFSDTTGVRDTAGFREPGAHEQTNRAARSKASEYISEEDAREFLGASAQEAAEKPPRSAWAEAESNLFDAAEAGTTGFYKSNKEKLAEYLAASKVNTAKAREAARSAKQDQRWAAQDERDVKVKAWLEGKTVDEVNQLVSSEKFLGLPEIAQERIFTALDELGYEAQAETDFAIEQIEGEDFTLPAPEYAAVLPWENRADQEEEDEDDSTEFAGGRF